MHKALVGHGNGTRNGTAVDSDDWQTDPDFVNDTDEKSSRWGSKTVAGSGHQAAVSMETLRQEVLVGDSEVKKKQMNEMPKSSEGYGGKFGVQNVVDKCAEGWDFKGVVEKHPSQKDYAKGFGGKFGIENTVDSSAVGWDYREQLAKHDSQKDYSKGFGGKFGLDNTVDKSAVDWKYHENLAKHESQTDYAKGFGGKFGVQNVVDKSAVGWDHHEQLAKHESQTDHSKGFGGKFGVQETADKSALGWNHREELAKHESQTDYAKGFGGKFGLQPVQDKAAVGWDADKNAHNGTTTSKPKVEPPAASVEKGKASSLKAKFEQLIVSEAQPVDGQRLKEQQEKRKQEDLAQQAEQRRIEEKRQELVAKANEARERAASANEESDHAADYMQTEIVPARSSRVPVGAVPMLGNSAMVSSLVNSPPKNVESVPFDRPVTTHDSSHTAYAEENQFSPPHEAAVLPHSDASNPTRVRFASSDAQENAATNLPSEVVKHHADDVPTEKEGEFGDAPSIDANGNAAYVDVHPLALQQSSHPMADTGLRAIVLYDYDAADDDEISLEPEAIVSNIERIDEGWWRGINYLEHLRL